MPRRKRRRGGQPGNHNARKHGCYSKILSAEEQRLLTVASFPGINAEIALLRSRIRSLVQEESCPTAPLTRTIQSLCRLVRLQSNLASLKELRSLANVQITALEKLSRAKPMERIDSNKPISKLIDATQNISGETIPASYLPPLPTVKSVPGSIQGYNENSH
jgi:hypothetical protein